MTQEKVNTIYAQFWRANPHVPKQMADSIIARFNAEHTIWELSVALLTEVAAEVLREDNYKAATRFQATLTADQYKPTIEANPSLKQALDGELSSQVLDVKTIRVVTPDTPSPRPFVISGPQHESRVERAERSFRIGRYGR